MERLFEMSSLAMNPIETGRRFQGIKLGDVGYAFSRRGDGVRFSVVTTGPGPGRVQVSGFDLTAAEWAAIEPANIKLDKAIDALRTAAVALCDCSWDGTEGRDHEVGCAAAFVREAIAKAEA